MVGSQRSRRAASRELVGHEARPSGVIVAIHGWYERDSPDYERLIQLANDFRAKLADLPGATEKMIAAELDELGAATNLVITTNFRLAARLRKGWIRRPRARFVVVIGTPPVGRRRARSLRSVEFVADPAACEALLRDRYALRPWPRVYETRAAQ